VILALKLRTYFGKMLFRYVLLVRNRELGTSQAKVDTKTRNIYP